MILYKNVDICDLESILEKGILSLDESGNNNWDEGNRANNATDCVYLFQPVEGKPNAFPKYGVALLEVEVDKAEKSELGEIDAHKDDYIEYTVARVETDQIKRVAIPKVFKDRLKLSESVEKMVEWCGFSADFYNKNLDLVHADADILTTFAKTAEVEDSSCYNFFRGKDEKGRMIDLYDVRYVF